MAIKISSNTIVTDDKVLQNVTGFKTVNSQAILGTGDIVTSNYSMQVFTTPGTWNPPTGLKAVKVIVVGGGGAARPDGLPGFSGGGGGGGSAIKYIPASYLPGPITVTVGNGGFRSMPAPAPVSPANANTSSFGDFVSATGGQGSTGGRAGGAGSNGSVNISGGDGEASRSGTVSIGPGPAPVGSFPWAAYGAGGGTILAAQDAPRLTQGFPMPAVTGREGNLYGGGASGGNSTPYPGTGANGANGIVIVEEFY